MKLRQNLIKRAKLTENNRTSKKTEGEIKNGQCRETGNMGYHRTHEDKLQNNTTQKTKKISNTKPHQNPRANPGASERRAVSTSYKAPAILLI